MRDESGNSYVGTYKDNIRYGYGEFTWYNGETFKGMFVDDKHEGFGILKEHDMTYVGTFKNHQYDGFGKLTWRDGD